MQANNDTTPLATLEQLLLVLVADYACLLNRNHGVCAANFKAKTAVSVVAAAATPATA
jgi:hypothetical protein